MIEDKTTNRLLMYKNILEKAVEIRKQNISAKNLAETLEIEPTSIYRMERGVNDMKLTTFLAYLDAFDYQLEITPKVKSPAGKTSLEIATKNGIEFDVEHSLINPSELDRCHRLRLLQYLIKLEEEYINENEENV